jgi:hypothetical protein
MSWGAIAGAAVSVVGGMVAKNNGPKAPGAAQYNPVDPQAEARKAIQGDLANQDDIEQLLTRANRYTQGQANDLMEQAVPGYGKLSQTLMGRAQEQADNPYGVPKDVEANLTRIAAERGVSRGTRGQTNQFSLLRDLGVNELQYGQTNMRDSLNALTTLTGIAPRVSAASPLSFYITPSQQMAATTTNNQTQQQINQGSLNAGAAAANYANDSMWSGILKGAGLLASQDWTGKAAGANAAGDAGAAAGATISNPDGWKGP